ncbi:probable LRR receptor-like serine/threonine-protein kinase At1g67720 [Nymphaea colorata]|nr:probable LRR receptor-like serine/threonine-protein kinase At1g67720 [Nymphaea colorata]
MRIHHKNLVSLVGFYVKQDEIILVSEYMANGSLSEILKGLEYLHTGCKPSVIHRDIMPANILLDEILQSKLADFGLSKAGAVDGTECSAYQTYIDPEYLETRTLTKGSDVYSFGVVLFELIVGKPAQITTEMNGKQHLTKWIMPIPLSGKIERIRDPLSKGRCNVKSVWEVVTIATTAIEHPRPDMSMIVGALKEALRMETLSRF